MNIEFNDICAIDPTNRQQICAIYCHVNDGKNILHGNMEQ